MLAVLGELARSFCPTDVLGGLTREVRVVPAPFSFFLLLLLGFQQDAVEAALRDDR